MLESKILYFGWYFPSSLPGLLRTGSAGSERRSLMQMRSLVETAHFASYFIFDFIFLIMKSFLSLNDE